MSAPSSIVVLGGGSAGWITACLLHHAWRARGVKVTLIESSAIGIIGVGEGSTPQLKAFFDHLGIAEGDWMAACDATYKFGIRFTGWSERAGYESYFHPFPGPTDLHTEPGFSHNCALARRGFSVPAHPDAWFLAARLAAERKGPQANPAFPFAPSYGYHFDAYKLGAFLREWGTARGIAHRDAKIAQVEVANGEVAALVTDEGERITGDLFVDCSGFAALIAEKALGGKHVSYADGLWADSAVVMPTPHDGAYSPQTEAVALSAGWRWRIPLTHRHGNGYVYASRYLDHDAAEAELRASLGDAEGETRRLSMRVGRLSESWRGNCLAVGLAQGFLEPLEATALHIAIATALEFIEAYEKGGFTPRHRDRFNASIGARYDSIRDYILAHYRMNRRTDTPFWRDAAANDALPDTLKRMMTAWFRHEDIGQVNAETYAVPAYSAMSWNALLAGYGTFPPEDRMQPLPDNVRAADLEAVTRILDACTLNFAPLQVA